MVDGTQIQIGAKMLELEQACQQAELIDVWVTFETKEGEPQNYRLGIRNEKRSQRRTTFALLESKSQSIQHCNTVGEAMLAVTNGVAMQSLTKLEIKTSKSAVTGKELRRLVLEAWCEAVMIPAPSDATLKAIADKEKSQIQILKTEMITDLRGGPEGIARWNARSYTDRNTIQHLQKIDLSGLDLSDVNLFNWDFHSANFDDCRLERAIISGDFRHSTFRNALMRDVKCKWIRADNTNFSEASLVGAYLSGGTFFGAIFYNADLTDANLDGAELFGADLSNSKLDGASFNEAKFDEQTRWPSGFVPPKSA